MPSIVTRFAGTFGVLTALVLAGWSASLPGTSSEPPDVLTRRTTVGSLLALAAIEVAHG